MTSGAGVKGRFRTLWGGLPVMRSAAANAKVPQDRLSPLEPWRGGKDAQTPEGKLKSIETNYANVVAQEAWVEIPIGEEWVAAYRLIPQDGVAVIGELRIFPKRPRNADTPGSWDGALLGFDAPVPKGGLSARLLRQVSVGAHLRFGNAALAAFEPLPGMSSVFPFYGVEPFTRSEGRRQPKGPGGRPRRADLFYARLAEAYVEALNAGHRNPVERVAREVKLPLKRVRMMLHVARDRRLLTRPAGGQQGRAGGALMPRAQTLLRNVAPRAARKRGRK